MEKLANIRDILILTKMINMDMSVNKAENYV